MENYISHFLSRHSYPKEACEAVLDAWSQLKKCDDVIKLIDDFYKDENINIDREQGMLFESAKKYNVNFYTAKLTVYICLSKTLEEKYYAAGYSEEFWLENIADLKIKMMECYDVHGVWGIFSAGWFGSVFRMGTFTIGRMCYNVGEYDGEDFSVGGTTVKKGDKFISIHIPSSGKPFDKNSRLESYRRASEFFKISLFRCDSWLLFPINRDILKSNSNIVSFMDDFKIVKSHEYKDNSIMWRIFGSKYTLPAEELPRDSSLRKAYAELLSEGKRPGSGLGYFIYDKEKDDILK